MKIMNDHQISHAVELSDKSLWESNQCENLWSVRMLQNAPHTVREMGDLISLLWEQTLEGSGGRGLGNIYYMVIDSTHSLYSGQLRQTQTLYYKDETAELKY